VSRRRSRVGSDVLAGLAAARPRAAQPPAAVPARTWYRIENHADGPAEVWLYDEIGYWGVTAQEFARELADLDAEEIVVRLNSPGGDVFDGLAILNALRDHRASVTVKVDGLAASAASFIAQAGDEIVMARQSQMMIHDASGLCIGNASDMEEMRTVLDRLSDTIASVYADRAGGGSKKWRTAMRAETWYSAEEAVSAGLADEVAPLPKKDADRAAAAAAQWDLSVFRHASREQAPAPGVAAQFGADEPLPEWERQLLLGQTRAVAVVEVAEAPAEAEQDTAAVEPVRTDADDPASAGTGTSPEPAEAVSASPVSAERDEEEPPVPAEEPVVSTEDALTALRKTITTVPSTEDALAALRRQLQ
jgi:ATP-dependent protease ClpP protease subunit